MNVSSYLTPIWIVVACTIVAVMIIFVMVFAREGGIDIGDIGWILVESVLGAAVAYVIACGFWGPKLETDIESAYGISTLSVDSKTSLGTQIINDGCCAHIYDVDGVTADGDIVNLRAVVDSSGNLTLYEQKDVKDDWSVVPTVDES